jgi:Dihydroorotate dehydrogenase
VEHSVNLPELLKKIVKHCGSQQRAATKIGVREETVRSWLKNPEKLNRSHVDSVERLLEAAEAMGIEVEGFVQREPLWDASLDYGRNLEKEPGPPPRLKTEFKNHGVPAFGQLLNSPFGASASVVTSSSGRIRYLASTGADVLTYKTVRSRDYPPHMWPNLFFCSQQTPVLDPSRKIPQIRVGLQSEEYRPAFGSLNWYGVPSSCVEQWKADFRIAQSYLKRGQILILSVMGTAEQGDSQEALIADFVEAVRHGVDAGAGIVELNLSCPNTKAENGKLFKDVEAASKICQQIRQQNSGVKLLLKIGFMTGDELRRFV